MQHGGWEWVSPAGTPPLQQDPLPAGLQLGFGVSVPRGQLGFGRERTAACEFTLCDGCRLRPADSEQRERVWSLLRGLLETYTHLREEDQSFAVEVPMIRAVPYFWGVPGVGGCMESQNVGKGSRLGTLGQLPGAMGAQTCP